jgi:superoxide dismutase
MRKIGIMVVAAAVLTFGVVAVAQQQGSSNQPSQNQPVQPGMMGGGMMAMMGQMGTHHQQMVDNMNKLMQSMSAIEAEKDPAALKSKLAAHRALLEQMRSEMMQQAGMMRHMQNMMGSASTPAPAAVNE